MSGDQHDQVPEVDLMALTEDQRAGLACINCSGPTATCERSRRRTTPGRRWCLSTLTATSA
jgi:hypothetical protein